jgi:hypothetical protein
MNTPTRTHRPGFTLRTAEDVLAKVPYLVGFHPHESLVVLALRPDQRVHCTLRADLPPPTEWPESEGVVHGRGQSVDVGNQSVDVGNQSAADLAMHVADVLAPQRVSHALLVAYTSNPFGVGGVLRTVHAILESAGVAVLDRLIADGRRWWSDGCEDAECCPPCGTPYDLAHHPVTARSVFAGEVALADEDALRRSVASACGKAASTMRGLIARMEADIAQESGDDASADARCRDARMEDARHQVAAIVETGAGVSSPLSDEQVARISVLVADHRARAAVAKLITPETAAVHQSLWTQVLRRTVEPHDAGPATLLAFAAWSAGDGALARCVLERVLASDPDCPMACFVAELLFHGVAPEIGRE